jgi:lambda repressor-like predicted transcriptional regulator
MNLNEIAERSYPLSDKDIAKNIGMGNNKIWK